MTVHPKSGLRYVMSIAPWPAYREFAKIYAAATRRFPWIEMLGRKELSARLPDLCKDERNFIIVWGYRCPAIPVDRKATCAIGYSEAYDEDPNKMLNGHMRWLRDVKATQFSQADGFLCHTPWMAQRVSEGTGLPGHVLPVGYDAVLGEPDLKAEKDHRFTYNGVMAGKRSWLVPAMREAMGVSFKDATGQWMRQLNATLNASCASLYLTHSDVHSFSTFRIWQTMASSAALIAESGRDCWPMTESMYVPIPTLTPENVEEVARELMGYSDDYYAAASRRLRDGLGHMTIDYVLDNYLAPASVAIKESRAT